jgi:nitrate reductase assembly molybdenum cofactor insertion protein NarJ
VKDVSLGLLSRLWLREPDASMAAAYTDLFLLNVYPYGTTFTDPSGELNGPAAWEAARCYEERGFRPPELFEVGAPDHVGLCLEFLDHLARSGEKDVEFSSSLLEWVPICCLAVEREPSAHPFYRALAAATRDRLMEDIPNSLPLPGDGERIGVRGPMDPEEEEVGLSRIVRFLLAPARSGLFLSRAKLGQIAKTAGMRLPFGSRFDVARVLFQTAGESGRVGTVLEILEKELSTWEAAYRGWAEEYPRWAPSAARWLHRTGETRRVLGEMREILENPPELEYADG